MKQLFRRSSSVLPITLLGLLAASNASAGTIFLASFLANPSFETNPTLGVCPSGWTCTGNPAPSFNSYVLSNTEYVAGADGLSGSVNAPDGVAAASSPTPVDGSGSLYQTGIGIYTAGNTYQLDLWVGTPLVVPAITSQASEAVGTIRFYFLGDGGFNNRLLAIDVSPSAPGQWVLHTFTFTPSGNQIGQSIGLGLFVDSQPQAGGSGNNRIADFDIQTPSSVPEPGTFGLLGLCLGGIGIARRWVKKAV